MHILVIGMKIDQTYNKIIQVEFMNKNNAGKVVKSIQNHKKKQFKTKIII